MKNEDTRGMEAGSDTAADHYPLFPKDHVFNLLLRSYTRVEMNSDT